MAPRPAGKGYLKLSLVSCAVELTGATSQSEKVSFRSKGRKPPVVQAAERPTNVVNLFDALKKGLASEGGGKAEPPSGSKSAKSAKATKPAAKRSASKTRKSA